MLNEEYQISGRKSFKRRRPNIHPLQTLDEKNIESEKSFTGKQKAAMLLASLDSETAVELIKGVAPEAVHELAEELRHLRAAGLSNEKQSLRFAQQFCDSLQPNNSFQISGFFKEVMKKSVGVEQTEQIQSDIHEVLKDNDQFDYLYLAEPKIVAEVLGSEHPQTAATVLLKMPREKISEVLNLLDWGIRTSVASRMYDCKKTNIQVQQKKPETEEKVVVEKAVCMQPDSNKASDTSLSSLPDRPKQSTRKLSVSLRNMGKEIRDGLLSIIRIKDKRTGIMVSDLMIFWEDIIQISDRSMQKALKKVDVKKMALALVKSDYEIVQKIQSNIPKTMAAVLNEQILLFSAYSRTDIDQAREEIVDVLREMNEKGELSFAEE
jgi:flagellar motor switch protein FliG